MPRRPTAITGDGIVAVRRTGVDIPVADGAGAMLAGDGDDDARRRRRRVVLVAGR